MITKKNLHWLVGVVMFSVAAGLSLGGFAGDFYLAHWNRAAIQAIGILVDAAGAFYCWNNIWRAR